MPNETPEIQKAAPAIPEDIKIAARKAYDTCLPSVINNMYEELVHQVIEQAILAERERCAKIADKEIDGARFEEWTLKDFAAQCRMQSKEQLDPEFCAFMAALSARLFLASKAQEA